MIPSIIVHGGAKTISDGKVAANKAGCLAATEAGWVVLNRLRGHREMRV